MDDIDAILKSSAAPAAAAPAPIASAVPAQQEPAAFAAGIPKPTYKPIVFDVKNGGGDSKSAAGGGAKGGKACYECGKEGHQARNCPNKDGAAAPAAGSGKACYECGKEGHQARNCPNKAGGAAAPAAGPGGNCFNCNKPNHKAKDCTAPKAAGGGGGGGAAPKACHICGRTNHLARECRFAGDKKAGGGGGGGAVSGGAFGTGPRLYVGNLSYQTSWQSLKDHFRRVVQTVHRCDVLLQSDGKSKGCAIVEVGSQADLTAALLLTDTELDGRKIFVRLDREEAGAFGGAGGGGGGGGAVFSKKSAYAGSGRDRAGSSDGGTSIYVGNLAFGVSWQSLKDLFASYGDVLRADVIADNSGKSKGFGIVKMSTKKEANKAIDGLHNTDFEGRALIVREDTRA